MSELRRNPFTGEWTLYAENRQHRPYEFQWSSPQYKGDLICPFCPGEEKRTPEPLYQSGPDGAWEIRVFPNMYPAINQQCEEVEKEVFYEQVVAAGVHELLIDTPEHTQTIDTFSREHLEQVLAVLQQCYAEIRKQPNIAYVQIFKNCGAQAGMSIQHSHWQLIGMPLIPERIRKMTVLGMKDQECQYCKMLAYEKQHKSRIVTENEDFIALTPYASRFPYEVWIFPQVHQCAFAALDAKARGSLADLLHQLLPQIAHLRGDTSYNICVMDGGKEQDFHWHLQILPRIGGFAGFECATECYINTTFPEEAAKQYQTLLNKK